MTTLSGLVSMQWHVMYHKELQKFKIISQLYVKVNNPNIVITPNQLMPTPLIFFDALLIAFYPHLPLDHHHYPHQNQY